MAEESQRIHEHESTGTEVKDRGMFDFLGKKKEEEKHKEEVVATEFEKVKISEEAEKKEEGSEKKHSLLEKLHRSGSSSSSVSIYISFML